MDEQVEVVAHEAICQNLDAGTTWGLSPLPKSLNEHLGRRLFISKSNIPINFTEMICRQRSFNGHSALVDYARQMKPIKNNVNRILQR